MSFERRFELPTFEDSDIDLSECDDCTFDCWNTGHCKEESQ